MYMNKEIVTIRIMPHWSHKWTESLKWRNKTTPRHPKLIFPKTLENLICNMLFYTELKLRYNIVLKILTTGTILYYIYIQSLLHCHSVSILTVPHLDIHIQLEVLTWRFTGDPDLKLNLKLKDLCVQDSGSFILILSLLFYFPPPALFMLQL
jgi:hypothetical protein